MTLLALARILSLMLRDPATIDTAAIGPDSQAASPRDKLLALVAAAAKAEGVTVADVLGFDRRPHLMRARRAAIEAVAAATAWNSGRLGLFFNRHRATIRYLRGQRPPPRATLVEFGESPAPALPRNALVWRVAGFPGSGGGN